MNVLVKIIAPIIVVLTAVGTLYFANQLDKTKKQQAGDIATLKTEKGQALTKLNETSNALEAKKNELATAVTEKTQAEANHQQAKTEAQTNKDLAEQRAKQIEELNTQVAARAKEIEEAKNTLATAQEDAKKVQAKLDEANAKAAELAKLDEIKGKVAALDQENKELGRQLAEKKGQVEKLMVTVDDLTTTPVTVRGRVASVQDRWGFLVLNVGQEQKIRKDSQFLVYRDSKLVCKVQVVSVLPNSSIAEVLPASQKSDPRVGDLVLR